MQPSDGLRDASQDSKQFALWLRGWGVWANTGVDKPMGYGVSSGSDEEGLEIPELCDDDALCIDATVTEVLGQGRASQAALRRELVRRVYLGRESLKELAGYYEGDNPTQKERKKSRRLDRLMRRAGYSLSGLLQIAAAVSDVNEAIRAEFCKKYRI